MLEEIVDDDHSEVDYLKSFGYSFEEAALVIFNKKRGLVIPPPGELFRKVEEKEKAKAMKQAQLLQRMDSSAVNGLTTQERLTTEECRRRRRRRRRSRIQCLVNLMEVEVRVSLTQGFPRSRFHSQTSQLSQN